MKHSHAEGDPVELRRKFWLALADSPYLFLQLDGDPHSAVPMSPQLDKDAHHAIWFFTHRHGKFATLGPATATFEGQKHDMFARFHGNLAIETSQERLDHFWNGFVDAWYDGGKTDPDLLLLRMELGAAEIWDGNMGLLNTAKMALGIDVHAEVDERHAETTL